jgi:hypothetical protein
VRRADQHQGQRRRLADLDQPMDVETVRRIAYELMSKEQAREFENEREMNLSHLDAPSATSVSTSSGSAARFRWSSGTYAARVPAVRGVAAPVGAAQPGDGKTRPGADRRCDRLGQVDHAGGNDRLPEQQTAPGIS